MNFNFELLKSKNYSPMVGLNPIYLERCDLHLGKKDLPIEEVTIYDFKISRETINRSGLIIFFDEIFNKCRVLKSKYEVIL